ncbi:MAG TPA: hypothetical protein VGJ21_10175, partial [Terracidiphilus sp.]
MVTDKPAHAPFQANVELLRLYLAHRQDIVESIEAVLNAQRKPVRYLQDQALLFRHFEDCFFARAAATAGQKLLRGQLEEAHWAAGFRPRPVAGLHNDLIHPAEMMIRGFYCWQQTHWPGRSGRLHYAHTLFNVYVLRCLQFLSKRIWDEDQKAGERLTEIQGVLDELWRSSPAGQPVMVRDARWLIPLAQSLITDELAPYFEIARQITETLQEADVLEIQKAHVRMLGGHLTSQIRYYCTKDGLPGLPIGDPSVVLRTRTSNALDFALLVQGLVGLLKAYDRAVQSGDERMRLAMAGAIFQGISADPELFLKRFDLLSAYSMIEHVFIGADLEGHVVYSPAGQRHVQLLQEYAARMDRSITSLMRDDFPRFRPVDGGCSPYGVIAGLPSNLIEHMALKALQHDAETRFSLEDVFREDLLDDGGDEGGSDGGSSAAKLAWVNGWRKLPHIDREVQRLFTYPQQFAEDVYGRIESELAGKGQGGGSRTGLLYVESGADPETNSAIPELPARYFASSDRQIVAAHQAEFYDRAQLLA